MGSCFNSKKRKNTRLVFGLFIGILFGIFLDNSKGISKSLVSFDIIWGPIWYPSGNTDNRSLCLSLKNLKSKQKGFFIHSTLVQLPDRYDLLRRSLSRAPPVAPALPVAWPGLPAQGPARQARPAGPGAQRGCRLRRQGGGRGAGQKSEVGGTSRVRGAGTTTFSLCSDS